MSGAQTRTRELDSIYEQLQAEGLLTGDNDNDARLVAARRRVLRRPQVGGAR
ncbi:hypothetical protein [Nocardia sp. SC052]|uniref:hypothetical protein n=1 Tax=Nocardia sichangensis TaxID=3385975 RepID=UPI0039A2489E